MPRRDGETEAARTALPGVHVITLGQPAHWSPWRPLCLEPHWGAGPVHPLKIPREPVNQGCHHFLTDGLSDVFCLLFGEELIPGPGRGAIGTCESLASRQVRAVSEKGNFELPVAARALSSKKASRIERKTKPDFASWRHCNHLPSPLGVDWKQTVSIGTKVRIPQHVGDVKGLGPRFCGLVPAQPP